MQKAGVVIHGLVHGGLFDDKKKQILPLVLIKNYGVRRLETTKCYYIGPSPIPELIFIPKKRKNSLLEEIKKSSVNSLRTQTNHCTPSTKKISIQKL